MGTAAAAAVRHTAAVTGRAAEPDAADIEAAAAVACIAAVADIVAVIVEGSTAAAVAAAMGTCSPLFGTAAVVAVMDTYSPFAGTAADKIVRGNYFPLRCFQMLQQTCWEADFGERNSCHLACWEKQTIAVTVAEIDGITSRFVPESDESVLRLTLWMK